MRTVRFYQPGPYTVDAELFLADAVFRHAVQVLRLKTGARIQLFDGQGQEYIAELIDIKKREATVRIIAAVDSAAESPLSLTLLQGLSRGDRMDFAIQKAVELGVTTIQPVLTERCNVQLNGDRAEKRWQHWQGVVVSACEQSGRAWLPKLTAITPLETALAHCQDAARLVLDPTATQRFSDLPKQSSAALLIGPEGGLTGAEIVQAKNAGFTALQFGPRILRTETASAAALAILQANWGDIG